MLQSLKLFAYMPTLPKPYSVIWHGAVYKKVKSYMRSLLYEYKSEMY